ncbi:transposase [Streptomyces mirabilis]|uniref:transposase n=1 Tax=Streptomyces mirabilis TaxID=68239 RepID=UPI002F90A866
MRTALATSSRTRSRVTSAGRQANSEADKLAEEIEEIFHGSGGTYGSPKVFIELVRRGWRVSVNRVAKVMAELGLAGRKVRRRSLTRPGKRPAAVDFVRRDFTAEEPDRMYWAETDRMTRRLTGTTAASWRTAEPDGLPAEQPAPAAARASAASLPGSHRESPNSPTRPTS